MNQVPQGSSQCWWCGGTADSREHRSKRTDLVHLFGPGPWKGDVVRGVDGKLRKPQSANSQEFKFPPSLCANCNNNRSQPFDRAYEVLIGYYDNNESVIAASRRIDLRLVFGRSWRQEQRSLAKYLVKHITCRLADCGSPVPQTFVSYLDDRTRWPSTLGVKMVFRSDTWGLDQHTRAVHRAESRGVFIGPFEVMAGRNPGEIFVAESHYVFASLGIHWSIGPTGTGGTNFSGPLIVLPEFYAFPPSVIPSVCGDCNPA